MKSSRNDKKIDRPDIKPIVNERFEEKNRYDFAKEDETDVLKL